MSCRRLPRRESIVLERAESLGHVGAQIVDPLVRGSEASGDVCLGSESWRPISDRRSSNRRWRSSMRLGSSPSFVLSGTYDGPPGP
jgi:hypothetical protein